MKRVIACLAALVATASLSAATASAAEQARGGGRDAGRTVSHGHVGDRHGYVANYCQRSPGDRDCGEFRRNGNNWGDREYNYWYSSHYNGLDAAAAGIFGLFAGAAASSGHVQRCEARYKSYDASTNTYLGYDGKRHACNL